MMKLVLVICLAILIPGCVENPYKPGSIEQINITGTASVLGQSEPKQMIFYWNNTLPYIANIDDEAFSILLPNNHTYRANVRWKDILGTTVECDAGLFNLYVNKSSEAFNAAYYT
ncbi:MAG TPA: hypothetical protein VI968_02535 [archaeon]|nr:hypothetical protein [archaeon]